MSKVTARIVDAQPLQSIAIYHGDIVVLGTIDVPTRQAKRVTSLLSWLFTEAESGEFVVQQRNHEVLIHAATSDLTATITIALALTNHSDAILATKLLSKAFNIIYGCA